MKTRKTAIALLCTQLFTNTPTFALNEAKIGTEEKSKTTLYESLYPHLCNLGLGALVGGIAAYGSYYFGFLSKAKQPKKLEEKKEENSAKDEDEDEDEDSSGGTKSTFTASLMANRRKVLNQKPKPIVSDGCLPTLALTSSPKPETKLTKEQELQKAVEARAKKVEMQEKEAKANKSEGKEVEVVEENPLEVISTYFSNQENIFASQPQTPATRELQRIFLEAHGHFNSARELQRIFLEAHGHLSSNDASIESEFRASFRNIEADDLLARDVFDRLKKLYASSRDKRIQRALFFIQDLYLIPAAPSFSRENMRAMAFTFMHQAPNIYLSFLSEEERRFYHQRYLQIAAGVEKVKLKESHKSLIDEIQTQLKALRDLYFLGFSNEVLESFFGLLNEHQSQLSQKILSELERAYRKDCKKHQIEDEWDKRFTPPSGSSKI